MQRVEGTAAAANLYSGTATSGSTGADIRTITVSALEKLHQFLLNITNCTDGATVIVRMYTKVLDAGAMEKFYDQQYVVGTHPDVVPIVTGTIGVGNDVRIEMQSDNASDTSVGIAYSYIIESDDIATILADTNELQLNQGNWLTATGFSVPSEYDTVIAALQTDLDNPAQYKADVSALATSTALATLDTVCDGIQADLSNGTDGLGTLASQQIGMLTELGIIKADTNELQLNQGNWLTATGFSVPSEYDTVIAALQTDLDNPAQYKAIGFATSTALATLDTVCDGIQTDLSNGTDGLGALKTLIGAVQTGVTFMRNEAGGKWEIVSNQMIFYKEDDSELMRFDLFDASGNPASTNVYKRTRV